MYSQNNNTKTWPANKSPAMNHEPRHETETQDISVGIHAQTWNKARRQDSARLEHAPSRTLMWKQDMTGVLGHCHKTMNNTRPK